MDLDRDDTIEKTVKKVEAIEILGAGAYIGKMGFGDLGSRPDAQIREEMDWPSSRVSK